LSQQGRTLTFLQAYTLQNRARFAAVFTNHSHPRWHFHSGLTKDKAQELMELRMSEGLRPAIAAAYTEKGHELKFAIFLRSDEDVVMEEMVGLRAGGEGVNSEVDRNGLSRDDKDDDV
jgi:hypothetical protein